MGDSLSDITKISSDQHNWIEEQDSIKRRVVEEDDFSWSIATQDSDKAGSSNGGKLRYVGGVDLSFAKEDPSLACGALVIVDLDSLDVVYDDFSIAKLQVPYIPGFLAFREAPVVLALLEKMKKHSHPLYPQLLMVDGNGLLHPRGCGLACHLGVMADLPTIGIGKNLHHVDGLTLAEVKQLFEAKDTCSKDLITLAGNSGCIWGAAMRSTLGSSKPIFISVGHRISLDTAVKVVKMCCKYRLPEPVRQVRFIPSKVFYLGLMRIHPELGRLKQRVIDPCCPPSVLHDPARFLLGREHLHGITDSRSQIQDYKTPCYNELFPFYRSQDPNSLPQASDHQLA